MLASVWLVAMTVAASASDGPPIFDEVGELVGYVLEASDGYPETLVVELSRPMALGGITLEIPRKLFSEHHDHVVVHAPLDTLVRLGVIVDGNVEGHP
jgi:hypothetical protein